jgi:hypothetical protein
VKAKRPSRSFFNPCRACWGCFRMSPCQSVKVTVLDRTLRELAATRRALRAMLAMWPSRKGRGAAVCPHIEEGR